MIDARKYALETIAAAIACRPGAGVILGGDEACALRDMLAEPRLPKENADLVAAVQQLTDAAGWKLSRQAIVAVLDALRAHLTKPKTRLQWTVIWQRFAPDNNDCGQTTLESWPAVIDYIKRIVPQGATLNVTSSEVPT